MRTPPEGTLNIPEAPPTMETLSEELELLAGVLASLADRIEQIVVLLEMDHES